MKRLFIFLYICLLAFHSNSSNKPLDKNETINSANAIQHEAIGSTDNSIELTCNDFRSRKIPKNKLIQFGNELREALVKKNLHQLADLINFPLYGDDFMRRIYDSEDWEESAKKMDEKADCFDQKDFMEHWELIFESEFISLISTFDFEKAMSDPDYKQETVIEPLDDEEDDTEADSLVETYTLDFTIYEDESEGENTYSYSLSLGYSDGEFEDGEIYHIGMDSKGRLKIFLIQGVG